MAALGSNPRKGNSECERTDFLLLSSLKIGIEFMRTKSKIAKNDQNQQNLTTK